jgi:hypothetical protein
MFSCKKIRGPGDRIPDYIVIFPISIFRNFISFPIFLIKWLLEKISQRGERSLLGKGAVAMNGEKM